MSQPVLEGLGKAIAFVTDKVSWLMQKITGITPEQAKFTEAVKESTAAQKDAEKVLEDAYKKIDVLVKNDAKTALQACQDKVSALNSYIDTLAETRQALAETAGETSTEVHDIDAAIQARAKERDTIQNAIDAQTALNKEIEKATKEGDPFIEKRKALMDSYYSSLREAEAQAQADRDRGAKEEDVLLKLQEANSDAAYNTKIALMALGKEYGATEENSKKWAENLKEVDANIQPILKDTLTVKQIEERRIAIQKQYAADMAQAEAQKEIALKTGEKALDVEKKYQEQVAAAAQKAAVDTEKLADAVGESHESFAGLNKDVDGYVEKIKEAKKDTISFGEYMKDNWRNVAQEANNTFLAIGNAIVEQTKKNADATIEQINQALEMEKEQLEEAYEIQSEQANAHYELQKQTLTDAYNLQLELIEKSRELALEAAGFLNAQTEEGLQEQIDRAVEAGDEVLAYQLNRKKEELAINKKYDKMALDAKNESVALQKANEDKYREDTKVAEEKYNSEIAALEEKASLESAEIQYKAAMAKYKMDIISATAQMLMTTMNGLATQPFMPLGIAMGAMATTLGGITIGMVIANKPKVPHFAGGGIVPGKRSDGDTTPVMATAGEIIMNEMQQERVADGIVGGKNITLDATFILDSEIIGKATFNWANDTGAVLKARAIIGTR